MKNKFKLLHISVSLNVVLLIALTLLFANQMRSPQINQSQINEKNPAQPNPAKASTSTITRKTQPNDQAIVHAIKKSIAKQEDQFQVNQEANYLALVADMRNSSPGKKREAALASLRNFFSANPSLLPEKSEELSKLLKGYEIFVLTHDVGESLYHKAEGTTVVSTIIQSPFLHKDAKFTCAAAYYRRMFRDTPDQAVAQMLNLPNDMAVYIVNHNADALGRYSTDKKTDIFTHEHVDTFIHKSQSEKLNVQFLEALAIIDAEAEKEIRDFSRLGNKLDESYQESYLIRLAENDLTAALGKLSDLENPQVKDQVIITILPMIREHDEQSAAKWVDQISNSALRNTALSNSKSQ